MRCEFEGKLTRYMMGVPDGASGKEDDILLGEFGNRLIKPEHLRDTIILEIQFIRIE